jgi:NADPH-dependent curcumin reductase
MTALQTARHVVLASRPHGEPTEDNFRIEEKPLAEIGPGDVALRVLFLSLDPYMRGRMSAAKSYAPPVEVGQTMVGGTVAEVIASDDPKYAVGDLVLCGVGWRDYAVIPGKQIQRKLDPAVAPISTSLGILGMPGFTAYAGMAEIGKPKHGETVVVAAASGPVGSAVGQLAKQQGARVVGIVGGAEKVAYLKNELGFEVALDRRSKDFAAELQTACPKGIDVYFENVGGAVFDAVRPLLNDFARIPVCGLIAHYNATGAPEGIDHLPGFFREILAKRLTVRGFIQYDFAHREADFLRDMPGWLRDGTIKHREDIVNGLASAPAAFIGMLQGKNFGKLLVQVGLLTH